MDEIIIQLEKERKRVLIPLWVFLGVVILSLPLTDGLLPVWLGVMAVSAIAYGVFYSRFRRRYIRNYKSMAVKACLESTYDALDYQPKKGFAEKDIADLGCMTMGNMFESEDWFSGEYDGVRFQSADVYIANMQSGGKDSSVAIYLKGRWTTFEFDKSFKTNLMIRQRGFNYAKKTGTLPGNAAPMEKIATEDKSFNYSFTVYGENAEAAFSILTPSVADSLMRLKTKMGGKMLICFIGNRLHVAYDDNKNDFEPPIFRRVTSEKVKADLIGSCNEVAYFAESLLLERKIWKNAKQDIGN